MLSLRLPEWLESLIIAAASWLSGAAFERARQEQVTTETEKTADQIRGEAEALDLDDLKKEAAPWIKS